MEIWGFPGCHGGRKPRGASVNRCVKAAMHKRNSRKAGSGGILRARYPMDSLYRLCLAAMACFMAVLNHHAADAAVVSSSDQLMQKSM